MVHKTEKLSRGWQKFVDNRFNFFLGVIIFTLCASPFFPAYGNPSGFPVTVFVFTIAAILILRTLIPSTERFLLMAAVYAGVFLLYIFLHSFGFPWQGILDIVVQSFHGVLIALFIWELLKLFLKTKQVTGDSIKGAICIYFLLGILWGFLYRMVFFLDPNSFIFNTPGNANLFYFSFTTLTTLGFGDIVPAGRVTGFMTVFEAVTGQLFFGIFIARMMGLYIVKEMSG